MSEALQLLNSLNLEDYIDPNPVNDVLTINANGRITNVPGTEILLGVETDCDVERKYFKCPRIVGDNIDLTTLSLRVHFKNANGEKDKYIVNDITVDGDYITFSWLLSNKVLAYKGTVYFTVVAVKADNDGIVKRCWNTTLASGNVLEGLTVDDLLEDEEEQARDILTQLLNMIENKTNESLVKVQNEIDAKGAAVLASIPKDYTETIKDVEGLKKTKADAIMCEESGVNVVIKDSSDDPLRGLKIFGKTTQADIPTPDSPQELVSLGAPEIDIYGGNLANVQNAIVNANTSLTVSEDGYEIVATGGGTKGYTSSTTKLNVSMLAGKSVVIKADSIVSEIARGVVQMNIYTPTTKFYEAISADNLKRTLDIPADAYDITLCFYTNNTADGLGTDNTVTIKGVGVYIQDMDWEPCKETQTLSLTTPNGLAGIPVTDASIANYTDADGQMWVADEIDLERGVYVKRVSNMTVFTGYTVDLASGGKGLVVDLPPQKIDKGGAGLLCTHAPFDPARTMAAGSLYENVLNVVFGGTSEDTLDTLLAKYTNASIMYILAEPIETPLSVEEITAYKALHTNCPNTTILNSVGANMLVKYNADTKAYVGTHGGGGGGTINPDDLKDYVTKTEFETALDEIISIQEALIGGDE